MLAFRTGTRPGDAASLSWMERSRSTMTKARALSPAARELACFCAVGASGYAVNLVVYAALLSAELGYIAAATVSFLVAASSNYALNRRWTFRARQEAVASQGVRALGVSAVSLAANQVCLLALVAAGADRLSAQAVAILLVTPFSFVANKLWAFARGRRDPELAAHSAGA
jgi:putative flippase GtrA